MEGLTGIMLAFAPGTDLGIFGIALSCGLVIIGAGFGIGWIASKAVESIARQPEVSQRIFTTMLIAAALIEGITFFALLVCFMALFWSR